MASLIESDTKLQVLSVFLGDRSFGIPIAKIQDVLKPLQLTTVPLAQHHIEGIANLRGRIVTAINLRKRLNEDATGATEHMNVVIDSDGELYSILVDRVGDVLTLSASDIEDPPLTLSAGWRDVARGVHQLEQSLMVVLDAEKIISPAQA